MCLSQPEPRVLERVRKKRRLDTGESVNNVTNTTGSSSLSSFVQSALRHTPREGVGRHTPHEGVGRHTPHEGVGRHTPCEGVGRHTPHEGVGRDTPREGVMRGPMGSRSRDSGSSSRKKQRIGSHTTAVQHSLEKLYTYCTTLYHMHLDREHKLLTLQLFFFLR